MEFELIKKDLQNSGSLVARDRNSVYFEATLDEDKTGFVYAPSKKRVYNTDELKKAIDVNVFELIPTSPELELDLVPRPVYNEVTRSLELARLTIESQSLQISDLEREVADLTAISASLDVELDSERLLRVTAEANAENLRTQFAIITDQLQTNIQRMTLDGIENSALKARNEGQNATIESLKKQVDSLTEQLNGKNARIAEGAKAGADITVRVINKGDQRYNDLTFRGRAKDDGNGSWINGPEVELFNFSLDVQNVSISQKGVDFLNGPFAVTLQPQEKKTISFTTNKGKVDNYAPSAGFGFTGDKEYTGTLEFKTSKGTVSLSLAVQKQRGNQWG
jgi:hypothetical protein